MEVIERVNPFSLIPNPWNTNRVDRENFDKLKKSLQSLGSFKPIVVREMEDGTLQILGGYHRNEAAKELGFETVPIFNIGNVDDARAKEISLVDNARYGQDDTEALAKLLDELDTELLDDIMPEGPVVLPDMEDLTNELAEELARERDAEETHKSLKFRLEIEKAEEIEAILSKIAFDKDLKYADGYSNYSEALYHALVLDK